jgi:hypothetical protein
VENIPNPPPFHGDSDFVIARKICRQATAHSRTGAPQTKAVSLICFGLI